MKIWNKEAKPRIEQHKPGLSATPRIVQCAIAACTKLEVHVLTTAVLFLSNLRTCRTQRRGVRSVLEGKIY